MSAELREATIAKIEKDLAEEGRLQKKYEQQLADEKIQRRKGFIQKLQLERREAGLDGVVLKAQEMAKLQANEIEQEERLAAELKLIRLQEIKEEKLRQYVRENSCELKELERQLKAAYVNKVLATQIAENKARKLEEQMFEQKTREAMMRALGSTEEMERKQILHEKGIKEQYRKTLQDQIISKERMRQEEYIAFMKEKKVFEDTIQKIQEEEEREKAEKLKMKEKVKEEMEKFYTAREVWKARERYVIDKENEKVEAAVRMKEEMECRKKEEEEKKKCLAEQKREMITKKFSNEFFNQSQLKEQKMEMLYLIKQDEVEQIEKKKNKDSLLGELAHKKSVRAEFQNLLEQKARQKREEKELDEKFSKYMNFKIQEEELKEREKEYDKRLKRIEDRMYNQRVIKENTQKKAENLKLTQMEIEFEEQERKKREQMIEEERVRILKEHAPHLLGYFPKGCLKERDLELLGITGNSPLPEAALPSTN